MPATTGWKFVFIIVLLSLTETFDERSSLTGLLTRRLIPCVVSLTGFELLAGSAHFPTSSCGVLKQTKLFVGHLRTCRADPNSISRNSLFHNHRTAAAIHLRRRLAYRYREEWLTALEC